MLRNPQRLTEDWWGKYHVSWYDVHGLELTMGSVSFESLKSIIKTKWPQLIHLAENHSRHQC
jgi:hypothetical protein